MENITFINNTNGSHEEHILKLIKGADEIQIAVGFFRESGFNILKEELEEFVQNKSKISTFYFGVGWGETEPKALKALNKVIGKKNNHNLVLCTPIAGIFHSKIYLFRKGEKVNIIVGSANVSKLGLNLSDEASVKITTDVYSSLYNDVITYLKKLKDKYYEEDVLQLITRYEEELNRHKKQIESVSKFKFRRKLILPGEIDRELLLEYYDEYVDSEDFVECKERKKKYLCAKENLLELASRKKLSQNRINELFGQLVGHKEYKPKLWHSGSIHRTTYNTLDYPDSLRVIVRKVAKCIDKSEGDAFMEVVQFVKEKQQIGEISGIGRNIITEMLMSFSPKKFANLNKNPLAVLAELGKTYPSSGSFKSDTYQLYIKELK